MFDLKKAVVGAVLALQMVFASAAGAMTLTEFKALPEKEQDNILTEVMLNQLQVRKQNNPAQAQCMDDQFSKISTNALGIPDGVLFVGVQIEKSYLKDPNGRHVEDVVRFAMNHIANKACSPTEQAKTPDSKENQKEVASVPHGQPPIRSPGLIGNLSSLAQA